MNIIRKKAISKLFYDTQKQTESCSYFVFFLSVESKRKLNTKKK